MPGAAGQAAPLLVGLLAALCLGAFVVGAVAQGVGTRSQAQRAADLGALAGARAMRSAYDRLFAPATLDGAPNPRHLERDAYVALGVEEAERVAQANGADGVRAAAPDARSIAPVRLRVTVDREVAVRREGEAARSRVAATAEAELAPPAQLAVDAPGGDGYAGPLAYRQGKPMRPDVAQAFDRLAAAARADGVALVITSAFRSDAEQARLFAARPDPKWVARPGTSLHRLGTELDLGPASAYGWLARNAPRFRFVQRYSWEPWHWGAELNAASTPRSAEGADGARRRGLPEFVPAAFAAPIARAAQRWNVSSALLAAQLYAESDFNPFARSPAGAQGIAQFMPQTARGYGLRDPFDAPAAIDAQAHLMRDLLRRFASVPLALAAYNAGPGPVAGCGCVPPFAETRAYVAKILGLMGGAQEEGVAPGAGLEVRLVE